MMIVVCYFINEFFLNVKSKAQQWQAEKRIADILYCKTILLAPEAHAGGKFIADGMIHKLNKLLCQCLSLSIVN